MEIDIIGDGYITFIILTNMGLSEMNLKDYDFAGLAKR